MTADKKEVLEYLRNKQKAAEIEAKVNGINLWVLLGATAVVAWQLLGSDGGKLLSQPELIVRTLLCAEAIYLLGWFGGSSRNARSELRYSQVRLYEIESPFLVFLQGALLLLPPVLYVAVFGKSFSSIVLGLIGAGVVAISFGAIAARVFGSNESRDRFPKPDFGPTERGDVIGNLIIGAVLLSILLEQALFADGIRTTFTMELLRQLLLLVALYLLLGVAIGRKLHSNRIAWTYELETELLLGTVSADVAARRIEHRGLGSRLQDVMDRFFDDLDKRFVELDTLFEQCRSKLVSVREVPEQYAAERLSRITAASKGLGDHIQSLIADCREFGDYVKKLEEKNTGARRRMLAPILASLKSRHDACEERAQTAKATLNSLLKKQ